MLKGHIYFIHCIKENLIYILGLSLHVMQVLSVKISLVTFEVVLILNT